MKLCIISDIHANWPALQAVLRAEQDADDILCLGDLVNYGSQPAECVEWAMGNLTQEWAIQGNHDRAFGNNADNFDVAPTIAHRLGATLPTAEGKVLTRILTTAD